MPLAERFAPGTQWNLTRAYEPFPKGMLVEVTSGLQEVHGGLSVWVMPLIYPHIKVLLDIGHLR